MTEPSSTEEEWATLRLTHPEAWKAIFQKDTWKGLRDAILASGFDFSDEGNATAVLKDAEPRVQARAVRLGSSRILQLTEGGRQGLGTIEGMLNIAEATAPGSVPGWPPTVPGDMAQGAGSAVILPAMAFDRAIKGIDLRSGDALRELGCGAYLDPAGQNSIVVFDYSSFPDAELDDLAKAIHPRNWPKTYPSFFETVEPVGKPKALTGGGYEQVYEEIVHFTFFGVKTKEVRTRLTFLHFGDPTTPDNPPGTEYALAPGGDGEVTTDHGYAIVRPSPVGTGYEIKSLKYVSFVDPVFNAFASFACSVWPAAIKATVEAAADKKVLITWGPESGATKQPAGSVAESATVASASEATPVAAPARERNELVGLGAGRAAAPPVSDDPMSWARSYVEAVASFMGRAVRTQAAYGSGLADRLAGNQEITLDRVADDSIEMFEVNTDLVARGADLSVELMTKLAKSIVNEAPNEEQSR